MSYFYIIFLKSLSVFDPLKRYISESATRNHDSQDLLLTVVILILAKGGLI